jgi:AraC-like DNA-binding protein
MAAESGYSPFHFHRTFRDALDETPAAFVERLRLERAALLLLAADTPVTHLAWDVGYRNPETFARRFRKRFGVAASAYRRHQLDLWSRLGLEAGVDPLMGPGTIELQELSPIEALVRRRIGDDEPFELAHQAVGLTLDWPGITQPGRVRQDVGLVCSNGARAVGAAVRRLIGNGLHATLRVPAGTPVPSTAYQRLFVWSMAGRHRLRPGAILEIRDNNEILVCLPVRDAKET